MRRESRKRAIWPGIMVWSADFLADDRTLISADELMKCALERLERRGEGVLLLHDIQPATAPMLPRLLRTLKSLGYHIVQVVPLVSPDPRSSPNTAAHRHGVGHQLKTYRRA
jgi:hypothetical protein